MHSASRSYTALADHYHRHRNRSCIKNDLLARREASLRNDIKSNELQACDKSLEIQARSQSSRSYVYRADGRQLLCCPSRLSDSAWPKQREHIRRLAVVICRVDVVSGSLALIPNKALRRLSQVVTATRDERPRTGNIPQLPESTSDSIYT
ncbi:hypothetical protein BC835DRAFT_1377785 [Cytidiella melzeri]|nr:hypothetical protein BC835DRAFT_1377785 [Cytidiella melzeri]